MGKKGDGFERDRGFVYVVDNRRPQFSDETLLAALREFAARGQGLTRKAYEAWPEKPCAAGTIANRVGGWWKALRRDGQKCRGCGRGAGEVKLEVDHIVPMSKGGSGAMSNLRAMCEGCNRGKGAG